MKHVEKKDSKSCDELDMFISNLPENSDETHVFFEMVIGKVRVIYKDRTWNLSKVPE